MGTDHNMSTMSWDCLFSSSWCTLSLSLRILTRRDLIMRTISWTFEHFQYRIRFSTHNHSIFREHIWASCFFASALQLFFSWLLRFPREQNLKDRRLHRSQQGQSKLVSQCLIKPTAACWFYRHERPTKTLDPKTKGEVGVSDQGETKCVETGPKKEISNSQLRVSPKQKRREPTDGVDSLKTHDHLSRWTAALW